MSTEVIAASEPTPEAFAAANARADAAGRELAEASRALHEARQALAAIKQRQRLDAALAEHHPVDLDTARTMAYAALGAQSTPDLAGAIAHLKRTKPFLFASKPPISTAARHDAGTPLEEASSHARDTGDRMSVLRYLRLKRGA